MYDGLNRNYALTILIFFKKSDDQEKIIKTKFVVCSHIFFITEIFFYNKLAKKWHRRRDQGP